MAGNVEDNVRYILRKRGYPDTCVRMADGYWMYGREKYYSPVYSGRGVASPAWIATRLIEKIRMGQSKPIEETLVAKMEALEPENLDLPGIELKPAEVKLQYPFEAGYVEPDPKPEPGKPKVYNEGMSIPMVIVALVVGVIVLVLGVFRR